jgi:hypothetical protein
MKAKIKRSLVDAATGYVNAYLQEYGFNSIVHENGKIIILLDDEHYKIVKVGITESAMATIRLFKTYDIIYGIHARAIYIKTDFGIAHLSEDNAKLLIDK